MAQSPKQERSCRKRRFPVYEDYVVMVEAKKPARGRAKTAVRSQGNPDSEEKEKAALAMMELFRKQTTSSQTPDTGLDKDKTKTYRRIENRKKIREEFGLQLTTICDERMHISVVKKYEDLRKKVVPCSTCECNCGYYHCPLCETDFFTPVRFKSVMAKHLVTHFKYSVKFGDNFCCLCRLNCGSCLSSHYHCPKCFIRLSKRATFVRHLEGHEIKEGRNYGIEIRDGRCPTNEGGEMSMQEEEFETTLELDDNSSAEQAETTSSHSDEVITATYLAEIIHEDTSVTRKTGSDIRPHDAQCPIEDIVNINNITQDDEMVVLVLKDDIGESSQAAAGNDTGQENSAGCTVEKNLQQVLTTDGRNLDETYSVEMYGEDLSHTIVYVVAADTSEETQEEVTYVEIHQQDALTTGEVEGNDAHVASDVLVDENSSNGTRSIVAETDVAGAGEAAQTVHGEDDGELVCSRVSHEDQVIETEDEGFCGSLALDLGPPDNGDNDHNISTMAKPQGGDIRFEDFTDKERSALDDYFSEDPNESFEFVERRDENGEFEYACQQCHIVERSKDALYRHYRRDHCEKRFMCTKCLKRFAQFTDLKQHLDSPEQCNGTRVQCSMCTKQFANSKYLRRHFQAFHVTNDVTSYPCHSCDKTFSKQRYLRMHLLRFHNRGKQYFCDVCNKGFKMKYHLKEHAQIHDKSTMTYRWKCRICQKAFQRVQTWEDHMNTHEGKRPYACDDCDKTFSARCALSKHRALAHRKERAYVCEICNESFVYKHMLKHHHSLKHTKEDDTRTYTNLQCDVCDQVTVTREQFDQHRCVGPAFACQMCGVRFNGQTELDQHECAEKGVDDNNMIRRLFQCSICDSVFMDWDTMITHLTTHQENNEPESSLEVEIDTGHVEVVIGAEDACDGRVAFVEDTGQIDMPDIVDVSQYLKHNNISPPEIVETVIAENPIVFGAGTTSVLRKDLLKQS